MTYILFNPLANGGRGELGVREVRDACQADPARVLDVTTLDTAAFFRERTEEDEIILCGGDGTIHRLVNDLGGIPPAAPVYIWRFGTGNDFLRDTAAPGESRVLLNDYMPRLPAAEIDGRRHRFLNGCSCGVDALVCAMVEEGRLGPGKISYALTAVRAFRRFRPMNGRVTVDGVTREYKNLWMAGVLHGHYQGGGMKFAPEQERAADTLTCLVWSGTSALGTLLRFPFVIPGKHTGFAACDLRVGREITVELDAPAMLQMDGEVIENVTGYTVRR